MLLVRQISQMNTNESQICVPHFEIQGQSSFCRDVQDLIAKLEVAPEGSKPLHFSSQFAQNKFVQYWELLKRNFTSYSRDPAYNGTR